MIASAKPSASAALIQGDNLRALNGSTWGSSAVRLSLHAVALSCGSRSIRAVLIPLAWAATARLTARVVFPAPPFCAALVILFMFANFQGLIIDSLPISSEEITSELE